MMENIPWSVGGGIHSPALARMLAYQATSGAEGIAGIGDFLVKQQSVAAGSVTISAGGGIMVSRYPGARNESYMCRAGDSTTLAVPQNAGGSTRYDLVIARVDDWNMPGGQATPASLPTNEIPAAKFELITNVAAATKTAKELGLNYPAIALARIAVPAATSAITQAMITDLREVAVPRRKRDLRTINLSPTRNDPLDFTGTSGEVWPDDAQWTVEVPEWASLVRVKTDWYSVARAGGTASDARVWVVVGYGRADKKQSQQGNLRGSNTAAERVSVGNADSLAIPSTMRGQSVLVLLQGYKSSAAGTPSFVCDGFSSVACDLEFLEAPTEDV